jgi:predicted Zn finger-like uncharacterized protein
MRFSCDECGRSYVASDDVAGRAFRMRCKQCGNDIVVRPPSAAPTPPPSRAATPAPRHAERSRATGAGSRPAFDPFEGDEVATGDVAVGDESLEILERTPPPKPIARPSAPASPAYAAPRRSAPAPSARPRRMLPAEDEAKLGPPGAEDRRSVPRWVILIAVGAVAAAGVAFLR